MSHSTCIPLYPATDACDKLATVLSPIQDTLSTATSGYKVDTTCIRQYVSWCKRGLSDQRRHR